MTGTIDAGFEEFERRKLTGTLAAVIRLRIVLLVVIASLVTWISIVDPTPWRRVLLVGALLSMAGLDVHTRLRFQRQGFQPASLRHNLAAMLVLQVVLVFGTGGLESPILPVMLLPGFAVGLLMGGRGFWPLVAGIQVPAVIVFFVLHLTGALPSFVPEPFATVGQPPAPKLVLISFAMCTGLIAGGTLAGRLRATLQQHLGGIAQALGR